MVFSYGINKMNMNFIEIYDDALPPENCDKLIDYFNKSPQAEGCVGEGIVNHLSKKSIELENSYFTFHKSASHLIYSTLTENTNRYVEKYIPLKYMRKWGVDDEFTLKKFEGEDEGFKAWHTEHSRHTPYRILVWMFYLNDAQSGTEFFHHHNIESKKGRLVIWPAGWTHFHKGVTPNKGIKYIMSGWYSFINK